MQHFYRGIPGWFDFQDIYTEMVVEAKDGAHFVEIGCWQGRSLAFLAVEILNSGKEIRLDAVDNFGGRVTVAEVPPGSPDRETDLRRLFEKHLSPVRQSINVIIGDSAATAAEYRDGSVDFAFIDAGHEFHEARRDIQAWLPKIKPGGVLAGHDFRGPGFPQVALAVHDVLGRSEVVARGEAVGDWGGSWFWRKQMPVRGYWHVPAAPHANEYVICVPYVNRPDLLAEAVQSVRLHWPQAVLIDQSEDGLEDAWGGRLAVFRWVKPRRFTVLQNWMQHEARRRGRGSCSSSTRMLPSSPKGWRACWSSRAGRRGGGG